MQDFVVFTCVLVLFKSALSAKSGLPFTEAKGDVFGSHHKVVAFADLNFDKTTDIITLSLADGVLQALYGGDDREAMSSSQLLHLNNTANLSSVVPADFDGDLVTDFLFTYKTADNDEYRFQLCFGKMSTIHYDTCINIDQRSKGEPMVLDYNADMLPDLLLENPAGNLTLFLSQGSSRNFTSQNLDSSLWGKLYHPQSSAFVDLNGDYAADIVLTAVKGLYISLNKDGHFSLGEPVSSPCMVSWPGPTENTVIGMNSFLDYDSDSHMDVITTVTDAEGRTTLYQLSGHVLEKWLLNGCTKSDNKTLFTKLDVKFIDNSGNKWSISSTDSWLRSGDLDGDGYPDLLVSLAYNGNTRPFVLLNSACNGSCSDNSRTFEVKWDWLNVQTNVTQVAMYESHNDGVLDIIYNARVGDSAEIRLLDNNIAKQSCFVSVKVGSGLCSKKDEDDCSKPYPNMVGATVRYASTHPDGTLAAGVATQLTQSTNNALQIPYVQFGLGTTPNFVDSLTVGIPRNKDYEKWTETWKTIIPNSHLLVVPRPPGEPNKWVVHLYVAPSHLVLVTGLVILALCALTSIVIALLHLKERYDDKKVKLQEAHKFHFSAM